MDPGSSPLFSILLVVVLILVNAFFAMSEIAVISANPQKVRRKAESGNKKAQYLLKITQSSSSFLATIQVGVTLSGFLSSAFAADQFAGLLVQSLSFVPIPKDVLQTIAIVVITIVLSYFTLIFGELVPKRLAMRSPETVALSVSKIIWGFYKFTGPFVKFLAASTNLVLRLFGMKGEDTESPVTEEDILLMVDEGEEAGAIEETERTMIQNIFTLDDTSVSDVMVPRIHIAALPMEATMAEALELSKEQGVSRIPVYHKDLDHIIGVLYVKDLLTHIGNPEEESTPISHWMRDPLCVPESKPCGELLLELQQKHVHMAIAIDEYGGTAGLVTMEDLLELIVGDIRDEYDNKEREDERLARKPLPATQN